MDKGWTLQGGVATMMLLPIDEVDRFLYSQAMVRKIEDE